MFDKQQTGCLTVEQLETILFKTGGSRLRRQEVRQHIEVGRQKIKYIL